MIRSPAASTAATATTTTLAATTATLTATTATLTATAAATTATTLGAEGAPALASLEVPVKVRRLEVRHVPRALLVVLLFHLRRMEG